MVRVMGGSAQMMGDLFAAFLRAMNTALAVAASAAFLAAVAVSVFVTRRIVALNHSGNDTTAFGTLMAHVVDAFGITF